MPHNRMNVAIVYSPGWREHVAVELFALFSTNPAPIKVYLISDTAGKPNFGYITELFGEGYSYEFIDVEELAKRKINSVNVDTRFTKYALYRLLLPEVIPDSKVLYVDADAIVTGDITEFYNMALGDALVAGVSDSGADRYRLRERLRLTHSDAYINAGVTLLDLDGVRKSGLDKQWLRLINTKKFACHDQCVINLTCKGKIKTVDLGYNVSLSTGLDIPKRHIKIAHFAGAKPWDTADAPNYEIWKLWEERYKKAVSQGPIPKRIHYCWFGGRPKPPIVKTCIDSWKKQLPDYEIIEWSEKNFDIKSNPYVLAAYRSKKLAFVTDYVRLWALYHFGGVYMDADVEVLKPFDDLLEHRAFTGHETDELMVTAVMGSVPFHPWIERLLRFYDDARFDMTPNTRTITQLSWPLIERKEGGYRYLEDGVVIYPVYVFCNFDHQRLKPIPHPEARARHLFAGTWKGRTRV